MEPLNANVKAYNDISNTFEAIFANADTKLDEYITESQSMQEDLGDPTLINRQKSKLSEDKSEHVEA